MTVNNTSIYSRAYTEVITILNTLPYDDYEKIPKDILEFYRKNHDPSYKYHYNCKKSINEQEVSLITKSILVSLYRDYFLNSQQKESLEEILLQNDSAERLKKYNPNDILKRRKENAITEVRREISSSDEKNSVVRYRKPVLWEKMVNKIKSIFGAKKYE